MKINQLFKNTIPYELLIKIINSFGYNNINDVYSFCKTDLENIFIIDKLNEFKDEISKYYLPCKSKIYLNELNINKSITLLRQVLRVYGLKLVSKQKYIKQKKTTIYYIHKNNEGEDDKNLQNIKIINNEKKTIIFI